MLLVMNGSTTTNLLDDGEDDLQQQQQQRSLADTQSAWSASLQPEATRTTQNHHQQQQQQQSRKRQRLWLAPPTVTAHASSSQSSLLLETDCQISSRAKATSSGFTIAPSAALPSSRAAAEAASPAPVPKYNGRLLPFPDRLHHMLNDVEQKNNNNNNNNNNKADKIPVSWTKCGTMFQIHNPTKLVTDVIPTYFNMTQYKSFSRQLLNYGFQRIENLSEQSGSSSKSAIGSIYYHPSFVRNDPKRCSQIVRCRGSGSGSSSSSLLLSTTKGSSAPEGWTNTNTTTRKQGSLPNSSFDFLTNASSSLVLSLTQNPQAVLLSSKQQNSLLQTTDTFVVPSTSTSSLINTTTNTTTRRSQDYNHSQLQLPQQQQQVQEQESNHHGQDQRQQRQLSLLHNSNLQLDPTGAACKTTTSENNETTLSTIRWMNDMNALPHLLTVLMSYGDQQQQPQQQQQQQPSRASNALPQNSNHHLQQYQDEIISLFGNNY